MGDLSEDILSRLRRLEDVNEIKVLKNTYHLYINDCRFGELADLFAEDAFCDFGYLQPQPWQGRAAIKEGFSGVHLAGQLKQFPHSHTVEVDGDRAAGWAFLEARYGFRGKSYNVAGKYDETYERIGGRWRFKTLRVSYYYSAPMQDGWAGADRHRLIRRAGVAAPVCEGPNPAL